VAAGCCLLAVSAAGACTSRTGSPAGEIEAGAPGTLRVLQLNLCDSGLAPCYTGRAAAEAARVIAAVRPDVVTLNEVCSDDVSMLAREFRQFDRNGSVTARFEAVTRPRAGGRVVRCRNGRPFGDGLLVHAPPPDRGDPVSHGRFRDQDVADSENRAWLCVHAVGHFLACTTHLASTNAGVALTQCRYLMDTAIPALTRHDRSAVVVVGADLNLRDDQSPSPQACVPPGFVRADDGARQDVMATGLRVVQTRTISMAGTTDHPALLVDLASAARG
jgi:endonuclease/exonuclease/phosphatase family metal-dependent hydrolase